MLNRMIAIDGLPPVMYIVQGTAYQQDPQYAPWVCYDTYKSD